MQKPFVIKNVMDQHTDKLNDRLTNTARCSRVSATKKCIDIYYPYSCNLNSSFFTKPALRESSAGHSDVKL